MILYTLLKRNAPVVAGVRSDAFFEKKYYIRLKPLIGEGLAELHVFQRNFRIAAGAR